MGGKHLARLCPPADTMATPQKDGFHRWMSCLPLLWLLCRRQLPHRYQRQCRPLRKTSPKGTTICSPQALQQLAWSGAKTSSGCPFSSAPWDTWCTKRGIGLKGNESRSVIGTIWKSRSHSRLDMLGLRPADREGNPRTRGPRKVQVSSRQAVG